MRSMSTMLTIFSDWGECYGNEKSGPSRTYRERGLFARTRPVSDGSGRASGGWESSAVCTRQRESIGVDRDGVSFVQSLWINTGSLDENATRLRFGTIAITAEKDQHRSHCGCLAWTHRDNTVPEPLTFRAIGGVANQSLAQFGLTIGTVTLHRCLLLTHHYMGPLTSDTPFDAHRTQFSRKSGIRLPENIRSDVAS